jgi:DNA-binding NarL/FixJ family response regulator
MVWTYPGLMHRASSLADLRGLAADSAAEPPIGSDPPGCFDPEADPLFFLLCDDLPDGELEQALTLLQPIPPERRRVLAVLADHSDRQRLQRLQEAGVDGLCTLGSIGQVRIYTAMDVIASGGTYLDPLFRQRLLEPAGAGRVRPSMT